MRSIDDALPTTPLQTRLRALIVEEDVSGLLVARRLLRQTPYHVDTARSAAEARRAMDRCHYAAVIVDDERLPDSSGAELLQEVERRQPDALRLLVAEEGRARVLDAGARAGRYRLVARPFFARPLLDALKERSQPRRQRPEKEKEKVKGAAPTAEDSKKVSMRLASLVRRRMLVTMAEMVESRLGNLGHAVRVSTLAGALAREAGLRPEAVEIVEEAALAHDLGELGTDREEGPQVHSLRRRLTPRETSAMQRHAESSHRIAHRTGLTLAALAGIRHHHERYDGKGYPDRLRGGSIPLAARIIAVVDTWDALAAGRPYHPAMKLKACLQELSVLAGTQLDPALVRLFIDRRTYQQLDYEGPTGGTRLF